jgi:hypothetical protein
MKRLFLDKLTLVLALLTFGSALVNRDFFYGLLLFFINFTSFKVIVGTLFQLSTEDNTSLKKYIFVPAVFIKMLAIGGISYFVLVYLDGNPYFYMGGFGFGLVVFTLGMSISHVSSRRVSSEEK